MSRRDTRWFPWALAAVLAWPGPHALAQGDGGIRGVVMDAEFDGPVPEAVVRVIELDRKQATGSDGHFLFSDIAPGAYTVTVAKPGYERRTVSPVVVSPGALAEMTVELKGEFTEMEELVVQDMELTDTSSEVGLLSLRGTSLSFQDSISKDLMSRAGASDAAGALRLVVGASVADGKYATVRGLSDRYVGTALNDLRVPSSDPKKRAVHMDMFPAGTIESVSVSKTFTPELPGDYTGGGVNIRTIGIPDEPFLKASMSRSFNQRHTGRDGFVTYEGAGAGRWGRHAGARGIPAAAEQLEVDGITGENVQSSHDELVSSETPHDEEYTARDRATRAMAPAMGVRRTTVPDGNYSYALSGGNRWDLGGGAVAGLTAAFTYSQSYELKDAAEQEVLVPSTNSPADFSITEYTRQTGSEEVKWSLLGSIGLAVRDDHDVSLTFLRNRAAMDSASLRVSEYDLSAGSEAVWEQQQAIHYTERSLDVMQLRGRHAWDEWLGDFAGLEIDWFGAHNVAEQEEPDIRNFRNAVLWDPTDPDVFRFRQQVPGFSGSSADRTLRLWRNTREDNSQYGLNVALPFSRPAPDSLLSFINMYPQREPWEEREGRLKMGFTRDYTSRRYRQDSYFYSFGRQIRPLDFADAAAREQYEQDRDYQTYTNSSPNALWTDVFTDPDRIGAGPYRNSMRWYLVPRTGEDEPAQADVDYDGIQNFHSGYWMADLPVTTRFRLTLGARLEHTEISIDPSSDATNDPARAYSVPVRQELPSGGYYYTLRGVPEEEATASIRRSDWLRSVGFKYEVAENMNLRGTWSQTIARPTFLELAPVITYDFVSGETFVGNNELQVSEIVNEDLRWEWFPRPGEVFAASIFRKEIDNPIERESFAYLAQDYLLAVNYPKGKVTGWEVEARKKLDFLPDFLQYLSIGANYTKINALVDVPENLVESLTTFGLEGVTLGETERAMQGQPEYLWNVNVMYDIEPWGTSAGLFYSKRGSMLKSGAAVGDNNGNRVATPDIFDSELATVNFSLSQKFLDGWQATFKAKNLLDPLVEEVYRAPDGTEVPRRQYRRGISYDFSLSYEW